MSTLQKDIETVFNKMPETFWGYDFLQEMRDLYPTIPDATFTRTMRFLRKKGKINYISVGRKSLSRYKKISLAKQINNIPQKC